VYTYDPQKTQAGCNHTEISYSCIDGDITTSSFPFCNEVPEQATDKQVFTVTDECLHKWIAMERLHCGRAVVQAVSRRLPIAAARVRSEVKSCWIYCLQIGTGAGFFRVLRFPLPVLMPPTAPHLSSVIHGWYSRPSRGRRTKWTQSQPTTRNYKIWKKWLS
jgi:hypothetical protein